MLNAALRGLRARAPAWIAQSALAAAVAAVVEITLSALAFPTAASNAGGLLLTLLGAWWVFLLILLAAVPLLVLIDTRGGVDFVLRWPGLGFHVLACAAVAWLAIEATFFGNAVSLQLLEHELRGLAVLAAICVGWAGVHLLRRALRRHVPGTERAVRIRNGVVLLSIAAACVVVAHGVLAAANVTELIAPVAALGLLSLVLVIRALTPTTKVGGRVAGALLAIWALTSFAWSGNEHAVAVLRVHCPMATMLLAPLDEALDFDGDGSTQFFGGQDCAPFDANVGPLVIEVPGDGIDQDCRGGDAKVPPAYRSAPLWDDCDPDIERLSVLLLTVDALRADVATPQVMPNLSELAQNSARFTRAYPPSSKTGATVLSMFGNTAVVDLNERNVFTDADVVFEPFLPQLTDAGVRVGGFLPFSLHPGITRSFPLLAPVPPADQQPLLHKHLLAAHQTNDTIAAISAVDGRFFQWTHYADMHAPYILSEPTDEDNMLGYLRAAHYVDKHLGRLFSFLGQSGLLQRTAIIVSSDHGEQLGQRWREGHGPLLYEEAIRVPLFLWLPGCAPREIHSPTSLRNLGPTMGKLLGVPIAGETWFAPTRLPVVVEEPNGAWGGVKRAVIGERYKLIVGVRLGGKLLFDLQEDPMELTNLYQTEPELAQLMEAEYQRWLDARAKR